MCHEYPKPINGYFSQKGQDKFLSDATEIYAQNSIFNHDQNYGKIDQNAIII